MIVMPRRSVTRFFIPMIDVLILLFCIFLLMPFVKSTGEGGSDVGPAPPTAIVDTGDPRELAKQVEALRSEIERLQRERAEVVKQLVVRPLEIDRDTGGLYFYAGVEREEIRNDADASKLIERDRIEVRRQGGRELYYLFLFPRVESRFPTERQVRDYQHWFQGVAHGFDNPRAQQ